MIEKKLRLGNLFDFYGELLTDKQREILELYLLDDFSLGEISDNNSISRQAVYDAVRRSEKILEDFEKKLGLMEKFSQTEDVLNHISNEIDGLVDNLDKESGIAKVLNEIKIKLSSI